MDSRLRQIALLGLALGLTALPAAPTRAQIIGEGQGETFDAARSEDATGRIAVLRALDKVTARTVDLEVPVDEPIRFGTLNITVRYCRTRPPEEPPETFAFLEIEEEPDSRAAVRLFTGWMIASSPALNPLEHPVYDVWVVGCRHPEPPEPEPEADEGEEASPEGEAVAD